MSTTRKNPLEFVAEATELVDLLARDVSSLEQQVGGEVQPDLLNQIFRSAHSLKGLAGLFAEERVGRVAHKVEDLLDRLRLGKADLSGPLAQALEGAVDLLGNLLRGIAKGESPELHHRQMVEIEERLESLASDRGGPATENLGRAGVGPDLLRVLTQYEEHRLRENVRKGAALWRIRVRFDLDTFDQGLLQLTGVLKPLGELVSTLPGAGLASRNEIGFDLLFASRASHSELESALRGTAASVTLLGEESGPTFDDATPMPRSAEAPKVEFEPSLRSLSQSVRVDIRRLDVLMNVVGELLLVKANVQRLAEAARQPGVHTISKLWGQELLREARLLERRLGDLQQGILEVRMVPLGQVFDKLGRLVRRIAREAGKEVEFRVLGGEVELDKLIVEELADPLMHLIRNALDHGVELPAVRKKANKPPKATLTVSARQEGQQIVVEVADDGPGINESRVREVAVQRGLLTGEQAAETSGQDLLNLLFLPGFSTARAVSELSGRGVGLDVVKTNITSLSGMIDVRSAAGQGTRFLITLPVTLAILRALVVSVSGRTYAVPLNSVAEIIAVLESEIRTVERREVVTLRGQTLPLVRLARLFGLPEKKLPRHFVVVVGLAHARVGIAVDELVGQEDVVAKPLKGRWGEVRGISGATDLGNRRTVLVLDVGQLVEEVLAPDHSFSEWRGR